MDNPPPKIVQGYKFNIFYPDLINKGSTPQYFLTPCSDNADFAILKFRAGPPYEDIAFKIVNREWEFSYKRGFRCQFQTNIFQLWFHFKRYRYRRWTFIKANICAVFLSRVLCLIYKLVEINLTRKTHVNGSLILLTMRWSVAVLKSWQQSFKSSGPGVPALRLTILVS